MEVNAADVAAIRALLTQISVKVDEALELIKGVTVDGEIKGGLVQRVSNLEKTQRVQTWVLMGVGTYVLTVVGDLLRSFIKRMLP